MTTGTVVRRRDVSELYSLMPGEGIVRLRHSLETTRKGDLTDRRTPFHEDKPRDVIVEEVSALAGPSGVPEVDKLDNDEKAKVGPISIRLPSEERMPGLLEYWIQSWNPTHQALKFAVQRVAEILPKHSIRALSLEESYQIVLQTMQSLGLPWLGRDKKRLKWYRDKAARIKSPSDMFPSMWYWRGQARGPNLVSKNRDVWGMPHDETVLGHTYVKPLIDRLRYERGFSAWNELGVVDKAVTRILQRAGGRLVVSMDYSGFDKTLHYLLLQAVDSILAYWCDESLTDRIYLMGEISATLPIVVPGEILSGRQGGMPSGSVATNLRDSIANLIAGFYVAYQLGVELVDYEVMGDDSVFLFSEDVNPEDIAETVLELGLKSNPSKQYTSRNSVHYLQRVHSLNYVRGGVCPGVRSIIRAISGLTGFELLKPHWNEYLTSARMISQLEACRNHPRHVTLVKYFAADDWLVQKGIDPVDIFKLAGGSESVRRATGTASFRYNVYDPSGVDGFATTRIIRSMMN